jgi:hypothetical protein
LVARRKKDDYAPLSIDKFLVQRSMKSRLPITRRLKEAKNRVRRPMEVGYHEVQRVRRAQPGLIADDFQCLGCRLSLLVKGRLRPFSRCLPPVTERAPSRYLRGV